MREIGRLADVSQSTVSLILNGKSEMVRICTETRDKVLTIAREHGYAPKLLARAMRTGDTGVIGILVSREAMRQIADNHGAVRGTLQLQAGFLLRDHRVMLEVVGEEDCRELRLPRTLSTGLVDTFILCESFLLKEAMKRYIEALRKQARCVIVVDEWLDGIIPTVKVDDEAAGRLAAEGGSVAGGSSFPDGCPAEKISAPGAVSGKMCAAVSGHAVGTAASGSGGHTAPGEAFSAVSGSAARQARTASPAASMSAAPGKRLCRAGTSHV